MSRKIGLLEKAPGDFSSSRAAFMLIIIVSLYLVVLMVHQGKPIIDVATLYTTLTATAITLKTLSKSQELKEKQDVPTDPSTNS